MVPHLDAAESTRPDASAPAPVSPVSPVRPSAAPPSPARAAVPFTAAERSAARELLTSLLGKGVIPPHPVVRGPAGSVVAWSIHLVLAGREDDSATSPRTLIRAADQGRLFRIRPGVYADPESWNTALPTQRHLATAFAIAASRRGNPPVFCRETALMFYGLGFWSVPKSVRIRARTLGASGHRTPDKPEGMTYDPFQETRHLKPKRWGGLPGSTARDVSRLLWGTQEIVLAGVPLVVEQVAPALADVIPRMDPVEAAVILDALLSGRRTGAGFRRQEKADAWSRESLDALRGLSVSVAAADRLRDKTQFARAETESAGESASRVVIRDLGFELPELQHSVYDQQGRRIGITDFWWKDQRLTGEFDGLRKYHGRDSYSGLSAEEVVTAEKIREDAIRAQGNGMVRWLTSDVRDPSTLEAKLRDHGVPYARDSCGFSQPNGHFTAGSLREMTEQL